MDSQNFRKLILVLMLSLIVGFSGCAASHQPVKPADDRDLPEAAEDATKRAVLGVGDEIQIIVWRRDDLNRKLRIAPSGRIFFPLVGEIQAEGLSTDQLRLEITEGLSRHFLDPQVNVEVETYRNRRFYVLGEVRKPGVFIIEDSASVVEAIALAGGFTLEAKTDNVILVRKAPDYLELRALNIDALLEKADMTQNVFLQRGDIVYVTPTTIVDMERFMVRFYRIIAPLVELERGIIFGYEIDDLISGTSQRIVLPVGTGTTIP
jgi:polysaccharide export outer membrane protein